MVQREFSVLPNKRFVEGHHFRRRGVGVGLAWFPASSAFMQQDVSVITILSAYYEWGASTIFPFFSGESFISHVGCASDLR